MFFGLFQLFSLLCCYYLRVNKDEYIYNHYFLENSHYADTPLTGFVIYF